MNWYRLTPIYWLAFVATLARHMWRHHRPNFCPGYAPVMLAFMLVAALSVPGIFMLIDMIRDNDRLKPDVVSLDGKGDLTSRIECPAHLELGELCLDTNNRTFYMGIGNGRVVPVNGDDSKPSPHLGKPISDLQVGEYGYTVSWAYDYRDESLGMGFTVTDRPGGTFAVKVTRTNCAYVIDSEMYNAYELGREGYIMKSDVRVSKIETEQGIKELCPNG